MFGSRTARLAQLLALTLALLVLLPGLALADGFEADADALVAASPHANNFSGTQTAGTTVAYDFSAQIKETGNASDDVFPSGGGQTVSVSIARAGDWKDSSNSGSPASFTFSAYNSPQAGTIRITVPSGTAAGTVKTMTVTLSATASNGKSLSPSQITLSYTITAAASGDTTPPDTTITTAPAALTNSTSASFTYSSTEAGTFLCSLDGVAFAACPNAGISYSSLADGPHTFEVKARDAAGNVDPTPASHSWTVDTVAPNTSITSGPDALTNSTDASFTYTASPAAATFECALDGVAFGACPSASPMYTGLSEGPHTFQVRAADAAGNVDATPASHAWTIDLTPPAVSAPDLDASSDSGTSSIDDKTNDATPSLSGTAEPGSGFELLRGSDVVYTTTIGSGTWSFTSGALPDGSHTFTARATDGAGNVSTSSGLTILVDTLNPSVGASAQKADSSAYTAGSWTNQTVTVSYTCTDGGSGVFSAPDADTISAEGADQSASGTCTDVAGNSATATFENIDIDKTAPSISAAATKADSSAYTAGSWTNQTVTVSYTCTDGLSGVASNASDDVLASEGADQSAEGTCTDNAGNSNSASFSNIDIDKTAPSISAAAKTADNSAYTAGTWTNQTVTVSYTCTDGLSGVASNASDDVHASEGADQSAEGTCTDNAGNSNSASFSNIDIDKTVPSITATAVKSDNSTYAAGTWSRVPVTVSYGCSDGLSGVASNASDDVLSSDGADQSAEGTCTDNAGNSASATFSNIDIDQTAPYNITWQGGGPANGATYYFGFVPAAPSGCSAVDDLSQFASCSIGGYSTAVGSHNMTATAYDNAGNSATDTRSYTVSAWTLTGFYQPVDMNGVLNTVKNGSTVPLKWEVFAGSTELTDTSIISTLQKQITCGTSVPEDTVEVTATGGTSLRYDSTGGQFIFNWQTPKRPGTCWAVTMTTADGSSIQALFKLK